jgi:hypothetical protein
VTAGGKKDRRNRAERVTHERRQRDRRAAPRVPVEIWVEEQHGMETLFRQAGDLSKGGVLLEKGFPKPVGTRVKLRFQLPGGGTPVEVLGEVVTAVVNDAEMSTRIKFLDLAPADAARIEGELGRIQTRRGER